MSEAQYDQLANLEDIEEISYNFKCMLAKIVEIIDGDHMKVLVTIGGKSSKIKLRLNGICTPDTRKTETK